MRDEEDDRAILAAIADRAEAEPEREVCGFVVADGSGCLSVLPVPNVAGRPREAFEVDPAAHLALARRLRLEGGRIAAVYHSHVEGPARLSPEDLRCALDDGSPTMPGAAQIVVAVRGGKAQETRIFAWDGRRYAERKSLARCVATVAPAANSSPS